MQRIFLFMLALSLFSCKKDQTETDNSVKVLVKDQAGEIQPDAEVRLFHSTGDLVAGSNAYVSLQTDANGSATVPESAVADSLIIRARKGSATSEFIAMKYAAHNQTYHITINVPADEQLLCGHGSKKWLMTGYSVNGTPQSYVVTSTLNADGTWTDTNGNSGAWHFQNNNEQLVYDYTSSGFTVVFDVLELTSDFISLKGNQSGMVIEMEMTAVY